MNRPIIIGVGGSHSSSGKTTIASAILNRLRGWGAVKYTRTTLYASIIDDIDVLSVEGKDTRRFIDAGASLVLWVQSPPSSLCEVMPVVLSRLSNLEGIIVEGNSAIEFLKPDIIIFIRESDDLMVKESGKRVLKEANVVYYRDRNEVKTKDGKIIKGGIEEVASIVCDMVDMRKKAEKLLTENVNNGKISCSRARKIAEELNIPYKKIGEIADEIGVKITNCELGCF